MLPLYLLGEQIAIKRKALGLTKPTLAKKARVGLSTLDSLENGRMGELGYSKITNILAALGLELKLQQASASRPTLEELMEEVRDDRSNQQSAQLSRVSNSVSLFHQWRGHLASRHPK